MNDWNLLRQYVDEGSQEAFAALVERHAGLVYSTSLREVGDRALAEDVAQVVFLTLARKAASLREGVVLPGWLFQTARFVAKNALKQERRRQAREQKAAEEMMREQEAGPESWKQLEPLLHDGLTRLNAQERHAILLRFFQGLSLRETGSQLGISEDAARMRVARALEKLRRHFGKHGFAASIAVLAALLADHAAQAAPARVIAMSGGAAAGTLTPKVAALSKGVWSAMTLHKLAVTAGCGALILGGGTALHLATRTAPPTVAARNATPHKLTVLPKKAIGAAPQPMVSIMESATNKAPIVEPVAHTAQSGVAVKSATVNAASVAIPKPAAPLSAAHPHAHKNLASVSLASKASAVSSFAMNTADAAMNTSVNNLASGNAKTSTDTSPPVTPPSAALAAAPIEPPDLGSQTTATLETAPASHASPRAAMQTRHGKMLVLKGRLASVDESSSFIVVQTPDGRAQNFTVPASARILLNDAPATLDDLRDGMGARIRSDDGKTVLSIVAHLPQKAVKTPRDRPGKKRTEVVRPKKIR